MKKIKANEYGPRVVSYVAKSFITLELDLTASRKLKVILMAQRYTAYWHLI
jgi:hypothetical protein